MPSPFAHAAAGYFIYYNLRQKLPDGRARLLTIPSQLLIIVGLSLLPNLDVLPGIITGDIGRFHNNFTHSLMVGVLVALAFAVLVSRAYGPPWKVWFGAALISYELHVIMDFFTAERGVMLLWPLATARFSSPVKLFIGVQWGNGWMSIWHLYTIFTEALFFLFILLIWKLWQRYPSKVPGIRNIPDRDPQE